jgi:PKD repeat protein
MTGKLLLLIGCASVLALIARPPANDAGGTLLLGIGLLVVATAVRRIAYRATQSTAAASSEDGTIVDGGRGVVHNEVKHQAMRRTAHYLGVLLALAAMTAAPAATAAAATVTAKTSAATLSPTQRKIVRAHSGTLAFVYQKGDPSSTVRGLYLAISRDGGANWEDALQLTTTQSVNADVIITPFNDIYLVYSMTSTGAGNGKDVTFVKLAYQALSDDWAISHAGLVFDGTGSTGAAYGTIVDQGSTLYSAYRKYTGTGYTVAIAASTDDGATWSEVLEAETPTTSAVDDVPAMVRFGDKVAVIYYRLKSELRWRVHESGQATDNWSASELIQAMGGNLSELDAFSAVVDLDRRVHVLYGRKGVQYTSFDGSAWSAPVVLSTTGERPTISTNGLDLFAAWHLKTSSTTLQVLGRRTFGDPQVWDPTPIVISDNTTKNYNATQLALAFLGPVVIWQRGAGNPYTMQPWTMDAPYPGNIPPQLTASASPAVGIAPEPVTFTSFAFDYDGTIVSHEWDFGDGSTGSGASVVHTYVTPGTYTATVTVTDNEGGSVSIAFSLLIKPNIPPTVDLTASSVEGYRPMWVSFDANAADVDGVITSILWNFGDGTFSSAASPTKLYNVAGTYTATVTVTDNKGAVVTDSVDILVHHNDDPVVSISVNEVQGLAPFSATFTSAASDPDGTVASYFWDFGDGQTSTDANPVHVYDQGIFLATLTVTDNHGATASASVALKVTSLQGRTRHATSFQNTRKIVRASTGTLAMIYQKGTPVTEGHGLSLSLSRDNGTTWSAPLQVLARGDVFADVIILPNDDIYVVAGTNEDSANKLNDIHFVKLAYQAGTDDWVVASSTVIYDAPTSNTSGAFNPTLIHDGTRVWVSYRFVELLPTRYSTIVKYSGDEGLTWLDSIVADTPGPNADQTSVFVRFGTKVGLIYLHQDALLKWRVRDDSDDPTVWGASETLYTLIDGMSTSKSAYSVVVDAAQNVHLLFGHRGLRVLRYDGSAWTETLLTLVGGNPTLSTDGTNLWAVWQQTVSTGVAHIFARYFDGSTQTWGASVQQLSTASLLNQFPTMIAGAGSGPVVAWVMGEVNPRPIMTAVLGIIP